MEKHLDLMLGHYGYIGIFLALALGVVGLPVPDELLLTFVGNKIAQGKLNFIFAGGSAVLGAITGITLSYLIGRKLGFPLIVKYGSKIHITAERLHKTQDKMNKFGSILLVFAFFVPGLRHVVAISAGLSNMHFRTFSFFSYLGAVIWCTFFIMLGRGFEEHWHKVKNYIFLYRMYLPPLIFVIIIVALVYLVYFRKPRNRSS